jgi:hypothetical protein
MSARACEIAAKAQQLHAERASAGEQVHGRHGVVFSAKLPVAKL